MVPAEPGGAWPHPSPAHWQVLLVGGQALASFAALWRHWAASPATRRPTRLSVVCLLTDLPTPDAAAAGLSGLPAELTAPLLAQWPGPAPGFHRLGLGAVSLTLCVGAVRASLLAQGFEADAVVVDARHSGHDWDLHTVKTLARCCRQGASLQMAVAPEQASAQAGLLRQAGLVLDTAPPAPDRLVGWHRPPWTPRRRSGLACGQADAIAGRQAVVVGGGLAGASVAASLAGRGWQVTVLDAADQPASGASGVPVGLFAPHWSPDDGPLSQLSRAGARALWHTAQQRLHLGEDWAPSGVLEHRGGGPLPPPPRGWHGAQPASGDQRAAAHWPADTAALWHGQSGWVKPARLVAALLATPGVAWRGQARVDRLHAVGPRWQLLDGQGHPLAEADLVVVAAGHASAALLGRALPLQPVRGQVSWGPAEPDAAVAPFPVNGAGSLVARVPTPDGTRWYLGATFGRGQTDTAVRSADHQANLQRLATLAPAWTPAPAAQGGWAGVRCASADRLPLVGPLTAGAPAEASPTAPWLCTGFGARGLCWALLCAELLAARLHGEPLPVARQWAEALDPGRFGRAP